MRLQSPDDNGRADVMVADNGIGYGSATMIDLPTRWPAGIVIRRFPDGCR